MIMQLIHTLVNSNDIYFTIHCSVIRARLNKMSEFLPFELKLRLKCTENIYFKKIVYFALLDNSSSLGESLAACLSVLFLSH